MSQVKYTVAQLRDFDKKLASGMTEREAADGNNGYRATWRKWVKAGKPEVWPVPKEPERKSISKMSHKTIETLLQGFDKDKCKNTIEKLVYISIITSLQRPTVKACDIKIAIEFLQLVHEDFQEKREQKNNVNLYLEGWKKLMKGASDDASTETVLAATDKE